MRITLDAGAMNALLNSLSPEARVEFSNQVLRICVDRLARNDITRFLEEQGQAIIRAMVIDIGKEYYGSLTLGDSFKEKLRKKIEREVQDIYAGSLKGFSETLERRGNLIVDNAKQALNQVIVKFTHDTLPSKVKTLVAEAFQENLLKLFRLGKALEEKADVSR